MSPYNKSITYCIVSDVSERTAAVASPTFFTKQPAGCDIMSFQYTAEIFNLKFSTFND